VTISKPNICNMVANRLARAALDFTQAKGATKAQAVAEARLEGMTEVLNAVGVGLTPFATKIAALDVARATEPQPSPTDRALIAWRDDLTDRMAAALKEVL
jgi:hypothetical protein